MLYRQLASWWPLLSAPAEYAEAAGFYRRLLAQAGDPAIETLLELGSGGGNNASHLKAHFKMTLVDLSPDMLEVSRKLNPECEHCWGDMRSVRLGRQFDSVFVHDAIAYMVTETDLRHAIETAFVHCRPGGVAIFAPDHLRENFRASTNHGGHDGKDRSLRYLEWTSDLDPTDTTYEVDFAFLLRTGDGAVRVEHDHHILGLFSRKDWLRILSETGFHPTPVPFEHSELEPGEAEVFVCRRPDS
ncbi:class I SAM-dependent methyltransferase [Gemmatimonadota bacterium]